MRPDIVVKVLVLAVSATAAFASSAQAQQASPAPRKGVTQAAAPQGRPQAQAAVAPKTAPNPVLAAKMKALLKDWEARSAQLMSLDVQITRVDKGVAWGEEQFEGRAILKSPNFAWLDFSKVDKGDPKKPKLVHEERIICTGSEVWQYISPKKQIFVFTLDRQNQKRALEEGPLPFLFNMKAAAAEARYNMSLLKEEVDHWVIAVEPKLEVDQEAFSMAFLKLKKDTYLPDRIRLISPNGKDSKEFFIRKAIQNGDVKNENFVGKPMAKPWTLVRNPNNDGPQAAPPARPANVGARQPAGNAPPRR